MKSLQSLVTLSSLLTAAIAAPSHPKGTGNSTVPLTTGSSKNGTEVYVTEVVYTTVTTCPAGQTVTNNGKTTVLPTPSLSTIYITTTKTVCPKCSGKKSAPTGGASGNNLPPLGGLLGSPGSYPQGNNPPGPYLPGKNPWKPGNPGQTWNPCPTGSATTIVTTKKHTTTKTGTQTVTKSGSSSSSAVTSSGFKNGTTSSTKASSSKTSSTKTSSTSSSSSTPSTCYYWLENIKHQGVAAFNNNTSYQVFRNVKDFGAKGDGVTDDTAAINAAISSGGRCGPGTCASSTTSPAVVYFPAGTYVVSSPIIDYYYTQIIGNPNCLPTIKATANFTGAWVIDGDQYQSNGNLGWGSTNVFWRQIRNFVIDITSVPASTLLRCIHWPTAQATSLQNIAFQMSSAPGSQHEGVFIESGSGGFVTDLTFNGGHYGLDVGNQQFTMRNLTFNNVQTAVFQLWDWGWTYQGLKINNCSTGLNITSLNNGVESVGSITFLDSDITNTAVGIATARSTNSTPPSGNSLILENIRLNNVPVAVQGPGATTYLAGSTGQSTIAGWGQGHSYTPNGPVTFQGPITPNARPAQLLSGSDYYTRSKPQYESLQASSFVSVRTAGAKGDGVTDDTAAIQSAITTATVAGNVVFFDAGTYKVSKTIYVPAGAKLVGESYSVIMSSGSLFADESNPQPVVQVGKAGETGQVEWSDMIVSTQGAQAGAILIQWNLVAPTSSPAGLWDVHARIGGFAGSQLQLAQCPTANSTVYTADNIRKNCIAAFLTLHVTSGATGVYLENVWLWTADHDVEDPNLTQITVYTGRGLLIEATSGSLWLYGTAVEHHSLYQYQLSNTKAIVMGQIQTETAYWQPNPGASVVFPPQQSYNDPTFPTGNGTGNSNDGWGLRVVGSSAVNVYGAGLYSFFDNYDVNCSNQGNGETCQARIFSVEKSSAISVYNLNTVGTTEMITLNNADIASYADNLNGFIDTIALFRTSS